jgi:hypothetical protein
VGSNKVSVPIASAPLELEEIFEEQEIDHIKYIQSTNKRHQRELLSRIIDTASVDLFDEDSDTEDTDYAAIIKTLENKLDKTKKRLASYRKKFKHRDDILKSPTKMASNLARKQKSIDNNLLSSHLDNTTVITVEKLCSRNIIDEFKRKQDPILLKYLGILFDGIYGNHDNLRPETNKAKELRFCTAIENLHKAHNSKYIGILSLRSCLVSYLATHSKVSHTLLEPILASGTYETIRNFVCVQNDIH